MNIKRNSIIISILIILLVGLAIYVALNWPGSEENTEPSQNQNGESFSEEGNLVRNNPGMVPDVWYLVYEEPGQPAIAVQLEFTTSSTCAEGDEGFTCNPEALEVGTRARVTGERNESGIVRVNRLETNETNNGEEGEEETMTVRVYFASDVTADTCQASEYTERTIPRTQATARAAINELLDGPTAAERAQGFETFINEGTELQTIRIENGIAYVDFNEELDRNIGGSCMVLTIYSQIENTLRQFPTVDEAIISINGETETVLQP